MAIWDFNDYEQYPTLSLERVLEMNKELTDILGESPMVEDMLDEIRAELNFREDEAERKQNEDALDL
jgi:hypothetical protein